MSVKRIPRSPAGVTATLAVLTLAAALGGCGDGRGTVRASGIIEMDETDVASLVGGRLARLTVNEGDTVRAGDTLAVLDRGEIAAELRAQVAQAERAAAQSLEATTGPRRREVEAARADRKAAIAARELAEREHERAKKLAADRVIAESELDRARSSYESAAAREAAATERLELLEEGSRREVVTAAREAAEAARANVSAARSRLQELVLTAPVSGVVLLENFEVGELVGAGQPVVTLGNPDSLWIRVYVEAPKLTQVRRGARATIHLGKRDRTGYPGRVIEIGTRAEFTPRAALTEDERANIVFAVKIALDPSGGALHAGLPADAVIEAAASSPRASGR